MSQIYYKFKSAKDYDNITFDGLGISVFDAKKEILVAKRLKGNDFDIVVSHAESGEGNFCYMCWRELLCSIARFM